MNYNNQMLANSQMIIYMKGFCRYEDSLDKGVYEITANCNYVIERQVKNVTVKMVTVNEDGYSFSIPTYTGWN